MFHEFVEIFKNDYINCGRLWVRPFSLAWWAVRIGQMTAMVAGMYLFYCGMWMAFC